MKSPEEWLREMRTECQYGEPSTPMLDRIKQIQEDAVKSCAVPAELIAENDNLRATLYWCLQYLDVSPLNKQPAREALIAAIKQAVQPHSS